MSTLYTNARFWSPGQAIFHDLLVKDSIILATGEKTHEFTAETTIDLNSAFVIPAFLDGHAHPIFAGREAAGPKINGLNTIEEIKTQVKAFAGANPSTPWIIGGAYEAAIIEGGDFDAKWLDEVVSDRPANTKRCRLHSGSKVAKLGNFKSVEINNRVVCNNTIIITICQRKTF